MSKRLTDVKAERIKTLNGYIRELEATDFLRKKEEFLAMPYEKQQQIREAWNEYYIQYAKSPAGENFFGMKDAFLRGDKEEIAERRAFARDIMERQDYTPEPTIFPYDPDSFWHDWRALRVKEFKDKIQELLKGVESYEQEVEF